MSRLRFRSASEFSICVFTSCYFWASSSRQRPSLRLRLGPLRGRLPVSLSRPPLGPPPGPPLKSDPFCVGGLTQDGNFSVRSGPGVFLGFRRPSIVLRMLLCVRCRSNLSRNSSVDAAPLLFGFSLFLNFFEMCLWPLCR